MIIDCKKAAQELRKADNILILTHANPDGDTLGSGFALLRALLKAGKKARLINNDEINKKFSYLWEGTECHDFKEEFIVSVDVAEKKLLGDGVCAQYGDRVNLSIDHHGISRLFAENTFCESESASCCELIYFVIKEMGIAIDPQTASCIYTGMSTDTGCFRYSNVTPRTHRLAAELIEAGADHSRINVRMFETKTMNNIMLERMCLDSLRSYADGKIALIAVTKAMLNECGTDKSALDAIKPITRQIEGVEIGITVKQEEGDKVGVSIRSSESYDAAKICANFGGGGHARAAGCQFSGKTVEEVSGIVVDYIVNTVIK
ncbi:MAG: DHH family phosphoesterase [Clostridia bacterium]|nr:DHH family phosphoesterase [Clostridia bacterium]